MYTRRRRRDEPTWLCIAKRFRSLGTGPNGSLRTQEYPYGFQNEFQQYENGQSPGNQRNCVPCMDTFGYLPIGQRRFCNQRPLQYRYDKAKKSVAARISEMPREKVELLIQSFSERAKKKADPGLVHRGYRQVKHDSDSRPGGRVGINRIWQLG